MRHSRCGSSVSATSPGRWRAAAAVPAPPASALLDDTPGATRTRAESEERFLALVRRAELPTPELNVKVGRYEVDALWREQGLVVEIDSRRHHGGGQAYERDRVRDADLDDAGLRIRRFTWRRITRHPEAVAAALARALATQRQPLRFDESHREIDARNTA